MNEDKLKEDYEKYVNQIKEWNSQNKDIKVKIPSYEEYKEIMFVEEKYANRNKKE